MSHCPTVGSWLSTIDTIPSEWWKLPADDPLKYQKNELGRHGVNTKKSLGGLKWWLPTRVPLNHPFKIVFSTRMVRKVVPKIGRLVPYFRWFWAGRKDPSCKLQGIALEFHYQPLSDPQPQ